MLTPTQAKSILQKPLGHQHPHTPAPAHASDWHTEANSGSGGAVKPTLSSDNCGPQKGKKLDAVKHEDHDAPRTHATSRPHCRGSAPSSSITTLTARHTSELASIAEYRIGKEWRGGWGTVRCKPKTYRQPPDQSKLTHCLPQGRPEIIA